MAEIVYARRRAEVGGGAGGMPNAAAEPVAPDVLVVVGRARPPWSAIGCRAAFCAVFGEGAPAGPIGSELTGEFQ